MSDAPPQVQQEVDLPRFIPWFFLFYNLLSGFGTTMALTYFIFFMTEFTGLDINIITAFITVARIADLAVQMLSGFIIQRMKRVRPLLLVIPLLSSFGACLCYLNPPINSTIKLVSIMIGYCCIHFPMNFSTTVGFTLLYKIAGPNPANRMAITSAQMRGMSAGRIVISAATMPLIVWFINNVSVLNGYFWVTAIYGFGLWLGANYAMYVISKPYEPKDEASGAISTAPAAGGIGEMFTMYGRAFRNRPVMILVLCQIITGIAGQVLGGGAMYYFLYSIGDVLWQATAGTISGIVALGTAVIGPMIAKKVGKKMSNTIMYVIVTAMYAVNIFFADGNIILYIVTASIMSLGTSISMAWGINLYLDAGEIQYAETGVDNRSFLMSFQNFPIKVGFIASGPVVAWMLNASNYSVVDGVGSIPDTGLFVTIWMGIIVACYVLSGVLFQIGYNVDEKYAAECAAANAEKARAEMAAAAAAAAE